MSPRELIDEILLMRKMNESIAKTKSRLEEEIEELHKIIHYWKKEYDEAKIKFGAKSTLSKIQKLMLNKEEIVRL